MKPPKLALIISLVFYVASAGITYAALTTLNPSTPQSMTVATDQVAKPGTLGTLLTIDPNEPKDQACPLNGELYTATERDAWLQRRPLAVQIENHPDARPQSGLNTADVVIEAVAEGGVTRFTAVHLCQAQRDDIVLAPVRSTRVYFQRLAASFQWPLFVHVGGANLPGPTDALGELSDWGWVGENNLNQFSIGFPTFVRDYNRLEGKDLATEHTMISSTEKLWTYAAEERGWTNLAPEYQISRQLEPGSDWHQEYQPWTFLEEEATVGEITEISYSFWSGFELYDVRWEYDAESGRYLRFMGDEPHTNLEDGAQIAAKNVIVFLTEETGPINELQHMLYDTEGTGDALIFYDGNVIEASWRRTGVFDELQFVDDRGNDVPLARGQVWLSVMSDTNEVIY